MTAGLWRTASVLQMLLLGVVMFVVPFTTAESAYRFSRGHSPSAQRRSPSSLLRSRHDRALKAAKTDTPTRSPDPTNSPSTSSNEPFTTSSFGLIDSSSPVPSPAPVVTTVPAERTFSQGQETSSETKRPRRRLVAILVPVLALSFLGLAFASLFVVRRHRRLNETYAELGSDGSSSASQSVSPPDTDSFPPITNAVAPQFVLPQLPRLSHLITRKATKADDDDPIVIHVERLEIADAGAVVGDGVTLFAGAVDDGGVTLFAGAIQLTLAHEQALRQCGIEDGQQQQQQQPSLDAALYSDEGCDGSTDVSRSDFTDDLDPYESVTRENQAEISRPLPQSVDEKLVEQPTHLWQDEDVELSTRDKRIKSPSWEDFQYCSRTSWFERPGNQSQLEVDCAPTSCQQQQSYEDPLTWKFRGTASWDTGLDDSDKLELRYMETAETDVSSSSCSASIP